MPWLVGAALAAGTCGNPVVDGCPPDDLCVDFSAAYAAEYPGIAWPDADSTGELHIVDGELVWFTYTAGGNPDEADEEVLIEMRIIGSQRIDEGGCH